MVQQAVEDAGFITPSRGSLDEWGSEKSRLGTAPGLRAEGEYYIDVVVMHTQGVLIKSGQDRAEIVLGVELQTHPDAISESVKPEMKSIIQKGVSVSVNGILRPSVDIQTLASIWISFLNTRDQ